MIKTPSIQPDSLPNMVNTESGDAIDYTANMLTLEKLTPLNIVAYSRCTVALSQVAFVREKGRNQWL